MKFYLKIISMIQAPNQEDREVLLTMRDVEFLQNRFGKGIVDVSKINHSYFVPSRYEATIEVPFGVAEMSKKFYDSPTIEVSLPVKLDRFFLYEFLEPSTTEQDKVTSQYRVKATLDEKALLDLWIKQGYPNAIMVSEYQSVINRFAGKPPETYTAGAGC